MMKSLTRVPMFTFFGLKPKYIIIHICHLSMVIDFVFYGNFSALKRKKRRKYSISFRPMGLLLGLLDSLGFNHDE